MKKLHADWFVEGTLDFEYKKYKLLAYLQQVSREFAEYRLYPSLAELVFHRRNLEEFQTRKQQITQRFPKEMSREEFQRLQLRFEPKVQDSDDLQEIESIISYAKPQLENRIRDGKHRFEEVEESLTVEPIGLTPLYNREGYLLLRIQSQPDIRVYEYRMIYVEQVGETFHGLAMEPVYETQMSLTNTYEAIKREVTRREKKYPNPATFLMFFREPFPEAETLLPVAKRRLLRLLSAA